MSKRIKSSRNTGKRSHLLKKHQIKYSLGNWQQSLLERISRGLCERMRYSYLSFQCFYLYDNANHHIPARLGTHYKWSGLWHRRSYSVSIILVALFCDKIKELKSFLIVSHYLPVTDWCKIQRPVSSIPSEIPQFWLMLHEERVGMVCHNFPDFLFFSFVS